MSKFSTRFNSYCFGTNYTGFYHFTQDDPVKFEKDKGLAIIPISKSMIIDPSITTIDAFASGKLDIYLGHPDNPNIALFEPYDQVDVATAGNKTLTQKSTITKKVNEYVISDIISEFSTTFTEADWNELTLILKFSGAAVPVPYNFTVKLGVVGIHGTGHK